MRKALALATLLMGSGLTMAADAQVRAADAQVRVQLLGLNDFHGQLTTARAFQQRPAGGAAVLVAYLREAIDTFEGDTLIVHAGDWVGASPPESALLQDEPAIEVLNLLANAHCSYASPLDARCNVVGTPGNHEFDEGVLELLRLLRGGRHPRGPFLRSPWRGARVGYVSSNVVERRRGKTLLPAHAVKRLGGIDIGVIGATVRETPSMVVAAGIRGVRFLPEAQAVNREVRALTRRGVRTIVVTIHQGGAQPWYEGPTRDDVAGPGEGIAPILAALDDEVDVVITGHAHQFTNARVRNAHGHEMLVTQSLSAGQAYTAIELTLSAETRDVLSSSARVIPTFADAGPGLTPAADVAELVERAQRAVAPRAAKLVGHTEVALERTLDEGGNSTLGNLIADAQRSAMNAQVALMNQGGIRSSVDRGDVTWGELFAVQPFGNVLVSMDLTGADIVRALEQQWLDPAHDHRLLVSGLTYAWDPRRPPGSRVIEVEIASAPLLRKARYRVVVNNFLAEGGSGFTVFKRGANVRVGPVDLDALIEHVSRRGANLPAQPEPRARRVP